MKFISFLSAWRSRLYFRTALLMFVLTILSLSLVGFILFGSVRTILENQFDKNLIINANYIQESIDISKIQLIEYSGKQNRTYLNYQKELEKLRSKLEIQRIFIFNTDWNSIVDTDSSISFNHKYYDLYLDLSELQSFTDSGIVTSKIYEDRLGNLFKRAYQRISKNGLNYFIGIELTNESLKAWKKARSLFFIFSGGIVVFSFIASYFFTKSISVPVRKLVDTTKEIEKGNLQNEITFEMKDEIGILASNMERMRRSILRKEEQQKLVLSGINHELKNPLGGIEMFASIIASETDNQTVKDHAKKILKESNQIKKILTDFNEFGKPVKASLLDCSLESFLEESRELLINEIDAKHIDFQLNTNNTKYLVKFDPGHLRQVLLNLLKNSIQFLPENGKIVSKININKKIYLDIKDTGPGIPEEKRNIIFEPFYSSKEGHSGLGLAIVKNLMEENKGSIEFIKSDSGAWFRLYFN
jgi:signal transduction histidine kinase